jgi:serine/threonine protein kinase
VRDSDKHPTPPRTQIGVGPTARDRPSASPLSFSGMLSLDSEGTVVSPPLEPEAGADLAPGTIINQYELIRELGRGGMGVVYAARDRQLGRRVAIKFLRDVTEEVAERFLIEARATAQCPHENIVIIYEANTYESMPFMVLEMLDGHPLRHLMGEFGDGNLVPASRVVELILPVARGLACAHDRGIIHRDLKPENIHVTHAGQVKVLDFGIAKAKDAANTPGRRGGELSRSLQLTNAGVMVGTLPYMSPEQMQGGELDQRSDLFALGIIMFEMLAGKHPVEPLTTEGMFENLVSPEPMRSARTLPDVPFELAEVIDRCLAKSRDQRMPDAHELARALEALLPDRRGRRLADGESPYPGLTAFQESDADRFFGRTRDIARMVTRIRELPLTAVVGPSGVGKSSFIRAGVGPALKSSGERWDIITIRPGRQPLSALAGVVERLVERTLSVASSAPRLIDHDGMVTRIRREPGFLGTLLRERAREANGHILVFVDQLEELYTLVPDAAERQAFTAALGGIADDPTAPLRVVVSMRSDLLDRAGADVRFMEELTRGMVFLAPPDHEGLREALVAPIEMVGYRFESADMIEDMLASLAETPGALPLLQFTAGKLWDLRSRDRRLLTVESYNAIGGISGALATHADDVIASMTPAARALTRSVLRSLVTPERTRAIAELSELHQLSPDPGDTARIIDQLVGARLLVVQNRDAGSSVELVHESLIKSWPTLRRWLDDDAEDEQLRTQLAVAAKQWEAKGRAAGLLWRGEALDEARRWFDAQPRELSPRDRAFLEDAFALATRGKRRRVIALGITLSLLTAIAVVASIAFMRVRAEQAKTEEALAQVEEERDKVVAAQKDKLAAEGQMTVAEARKRDAEAKKRAAEEAERLARDQSAAKDLTIEEQNVLLKKEKAEAEKKAAEALLAKKDAERATKDAVKMADKLEANRKELEIKLAAERKLREEAERRGKGLSKELK